MPDSKKQQYEDDPIEELVNGSDDHICQTCDGTGDHNGHLCKDCGGKGTI